MRIFKNFYIFFSPDSDTDITLKHDFEEKGLFKESASNSDENFHTFVQKGLKDVKFRGKFAK